MIILFEIHLNCSFSISDLVPTELVIDIGRQAHKQCLKEERDRSTILWRKDGMALQSSSGAVANQQNYRVLIYKGRTMESTSTLSV